MKGISAGYCVACELCLARILKMNISESFSEKVQIALFFVCAAVYAQVNIYLK